MKTFVLPALLFAAGIATAQSKMLVRNGCAVDDAEMNRNHYVFDPSDEAQQIIATIMDANILDPNFTIKSGDVDNALATFENGQRYIIYNTAYIERIKESAGTDWAAYYVFAHEIGHHLNNHRFDLSDSDARKEKGQRPAIFVANVMRCRLEVQRTGIYCGALHLQPINRSYIYKYFAALRLTVQQADSQYK